MRSELKIRMTEQIEVRGVKGQVSKKRWLFLQHSCHFPIMAPSLFRDLEANRRSGFMITPSNQCTLLKYFKFGPEVLWLVALIHLFIYNHITFCITVHFNFWPWDLHCSFYRASACNARRARCFCGKSVCLSLYLPVSLSNAGTVSKRADLSSNFLMIW